MMSAENLDIKVFINTELNGMENVAPTSNLKSNSSSSHFGASIYAMKSFRFMGQE